MYSQYRNQSTIIHADHERLRMDIQANLTPVVFMSTLKMYKWPYIDRKRFSQRYWLFEEQSQRLLASFENIMGLGGEEERGLAIDRIELIITHAIMDCSLRKEQISIRIKRELGHGQVLHSILQKKTRVSCW